MERTVFELLASPYAVIVADVGGGIVLANSPAEVMFDYAPDGMAGLRVEDLIPTRFMFSHLQYRQAYSAHPVERPMGHERMPLYGRKSDGSEFSVEVSLHPVGSEYVVATIRYRLG